MDTSERRPLRILSKQICAKAANVCDRTWDRLLERGEGPPVVKISPGRVGHFEHEFEAWMLSRRKFAPGQEPGPGAAP